MPRKKYESKSLVFSDTMLNLDAWNSKKTNLEMQDIIIALKKEVVKRQKEFAKTGDKSLSRTARLAEHEMENGLLARKGRNKMELRMQITALQNILDSPDFINPELVPKQVAELAAALGVQPGSFMLEFIGTEVDQQMRNVLGSENMPELWNKAEDEGVSTEQVRQTFYQFMQSYETRELTLDEFDRYAQDIGIFKTPIYGTR